MLTAPMTPSLNTNPASIQPANTPNGGSANPAGSGFARELSRHFMPEAKPDAVPQSGKAAGGESQAGDAPEQANGAAADGAAADKAAAKPGRGEGSRERAHAGSKAAQSGRAAQKSEESRRSGSDEPAKDDKEDTDVSAWLGMMHPGAATAAQAAKPDAKPDAGAALPDAKGKPVRGAAAAALMGAQGKAEGGPGGKLAKAGEADAAASRADGSDRRAERGAGAFESLLAGAKAREESMGAAPFAEKALAAPRQEGVKTADAPGAAAVLAAGGASAAASTSGTEAAASTAMIQAPTHSEQFAPALAAQVSIFARDGVHEAQLHLNPAETGPITVRIEVADAQARVDFTAEHAATRSAIESSLPDLAAALRDAGFTLAGGGVFQQAPGQGRQGGGEAGDDKALRVDGTASRRGQGVGEDVSAAPAQRRPVQRGALDLYA